MRTGLSTIQQTLTPEAASVLNHSIAEAARRNHGQTTPLHVAATLLASPSGYLRQACIRSHPNSSHPLQCRALELCFSVALERLPSAQNLSSPGLEPPISNALMAALKRAQAHQRRGCPEQQQQPLLAVKVELEQLIVSILDDPSVSRVMREASFSSPAVKSTIEQSLMNSLTSVKTSTIGSGLGFRPAPVAANRNLYLSPRLQQQGNSDQSGQQRKEEVKKVVDVLMKNKKRNPVLVGDTEPEPVMRELLQKIEKKEVGEGILRNVQVISLDKEIVSDRTQIPAKLKELGDLIENRMNSSGGGGGDGDSDGGVILNLGDLKWLVEQPVGFAGSGSSPMQHQQQQQIVSETGKIAVEEMGKLLGRFGEGSSSRLWMIGTATCETYLRCQVYHPKMENDWDLQAVPVAARTPPPGLFPRLGGNGILSSSVDSFSPLKGFPTTVSPLSRRPSENLDPARRTSCCSQCMENYEQDVAKLTATESEKSSSDTKPEAARPPLPQWMQNAKSNNGNVKTTDHSQTMEQELILKQKTKELQKKWNDTCSRLHPSFHNSLNSQRIVPTPIPMMNLYKSNPLGRQLVQPKMQITKNLGGTLQLSQTPTLNTPERAATPPGSPVRTELILGRPKLNETSPEEAHRERIKDLTGCIPLDPQNQFIELPRDKHAKTLDPDSFKSLFKGLIEKVWWQADAASAVATSVIHCRSGSNRRQGGGGGLKGDSWLLFAGPDRIGKKKMAVALSEVVGRASPITIRLGSRCDENEESDVTFRGKTTVDRIAEAVKRNPFSIIVLEDIDCADMLVQGSIKRAMERGRLPDSHGREISLGNVIFILTADWLPENSKNSSNCPPLNMEKLSNTARSGWHLQISVCEKTVKRRRTDAAPALTIDLNQEAEAEAEEDNTAEGSRDSSAVTVDNEHEQTLVKKHVTVAQSTLDLFSSADDEIVFKPVDFEPIRVKITNTISSRFSAIVGGGKLIEVEDETLEQILGGVWFGQTGLEEWTDRVLVPIFHQLKNKLDSYSDDHENVSVKLTSVKGSERRSSLDWLPSKVTVDVVQP